MRDVADTFRISESSLLSRIKTVRIQKNEKPPQFQTEKYQEEKELLILFLNDASILKKVAKELNSDYFLFKPYQDLYIFIEKNLERTEQVSALLDKISDAELRALAADLIMAEPDSERMTGFIKALKLRKFKKDLKSVAIALEKDPGNQDLREQKEKVKRILAGLDKKVVRKTLY